MAGGGLPEDVADELQALQAIYCGDGEFCMLSEPDARVPMFCVSTKCRGLHDTISLSASFTLPEGYPRVHPDISLSSASLSRCAISRLKQELSTHARTLPEAPMVLQLMTWLEEHIPETEQATEVCSTTPKQCSSQREVQEDLWLTLLHLDHMRARGKYVKTIVKWTKELSLTGRLLFQERLILILLLGSLQNIKEYITRQRTRSVDVDSAGRSCKERMLTVLWEEKVQEGAVRFPQFEVVECRTVDQLKEQFTGTVLARVYREHVCSLMLK
ncbi:PREDICTED: RWD domain-containing protein 3-like [Branchiostoma belcheri]|uniref:RWD domain-containing protein 3 n=1 Tax=Branchiostoma belcheri TaxID=7741 RepID=A0A6P5A7D6_BRABE|nr:PREDICTED: RWD domain-containing protein 3-like [Branchiostoma belcheri]